MDWINTIFYQNLPKMATNNDITFRIVKSSKGTDKLSHDGYLYIFHRGSSKKEWRCDVRGCKARIHSIDELIVKSQGNILIHRNMVKMN